MIALLTGSTAFSQVAPKTPQANSSEKSEEIITLSPFVVTDAGDEGYRTQQTMIGSRTAKNMLELPVSVAVIGLAQLVVVVVTWLPVVWQATHKAV